MTAKEKKNREEVTHKEPKYFTSYQKGTSLEAENDATLYGKQCEMSEFMKESILSRVL